MQPAWLALTAGMVLALGGGDAAKTERDKLQGVWVIEKVVNNGREDGDSSKGKLEFQGEKLKATIEKDGNTETIEGKYTVNPANKPAAMDFTFTKGNEDITIHAVYELKGDVLKICHPAGGGGERPEAVEAKQGTVLVTLKKQKG